MTGKTTHGGQLVLDLPPAAGMSEADFIAGESNRAALEAVRRWPVPNAGTPLLVLVGPEGCGKTHLAEIWRRRTGALLARHADVREENLPALLSTGRLVVEDMPGERPEEVALFHLINLARETGGALLFTARRFPAEWPLSLPDLRSRLKAAMVAHIGPPDDELLRALLVKLFADRQLQVGRDVISYLLRRMERSPAAARRLVATIDHAALVERARITRPFVARILAAADSKNPAS